MTDLKKSAKKYIDSMGLVEAGKKFNLAPQTVKMWTKTGRYPLPVIQAMLEDQNPVEPMPEQPPMDNAHVEAGCGQFPEVPTASPGAPPARSDEQAAKLTPETPKNDTARLDRLETTLSQLLEVIQHNSAANIQPDPVTGELPPLVTQSLDRGGIANLTRPSRQMATEKSEEELNALDPNRKKAAVDPDTLPNRHWMKPRSISKR
jgi:hypothetical protein